MLGISGIGREKVKHEVTKTTEFHKFNPNLNIDKKIPKILSEGLHRSQEPQQPDSRVWWNKSLNLNFPIFWEFFGPIFALDCKLLSQNYCSSLQGKLYQTEQHIFKVY